MLSIKNNYGQIKSAIVPIKSTELSQAEIELFQKYKPLGYILFTRNYANPTQLKKLVSSLKEISNRDDILVLIDQEGERVARLAAPDFTVLRNAIKYGEEAVADLKSAATQLETDSAMVGRELKAVGINVNCAPVADLYHANADKIISVRSYGDEPLIVKTLCEAFDRGLASASVQSVIKHIPGHGRANLDSHVALPTITTDLDTLLETDFAVFMHLHDMKLAMTAHVVYSSIDENLPVTLSRKCIDYIRNAIHFKGLIITDALDMKALSGDLSDLVNQSTSAGCDIMLYCEPDLRGIEAVLRSSHTISQDTASKILSFNCF